MENNMILVEDKAKREELIGHLEVLDKVKSITYITKDLVVTTEQVANYYDVGIEAIKAIANRHKEELESNGLKVIKGQELKDLKSELQDATNLKYVSSLALFSKRTLLNVGMLLTESKVAEKVRDYLLNLEDKATTEQKAEAIEETIEKTAEQLGIKLLRKQHREEKKLVTIQSSMDRLELYGLTKAQSSYVIQKAIVDKINIDKAVLVKVEELKELETNIQRGIVREKISYTAKNYYDDDYEMVYHLMSDKMRYSIGFNMRAERDRLKKRNEKAERGCKVQVPSYLDIIVNYNAYDAANKAIVELIDEKEVLKAKSIETKATTQKVNNKVKKEEKAAANAQSKAESKTKKDFIF